jgi:Na+/melibiose symporter-like transporter
MSEQPMRDSDDPFDALLAARFEREHPHVPEDAFVATTMANIRNQRRALAAMRTAMRIAALVILVIASPWLITGAAKLNQTLEASLVWAASTAGWALALLAAGAVLAMRVRGR